MNFLTELKLSIESINKNITDDNIAALQNEISKIGKQYKDNHVTSILKMMQSLGKYLGSKKDNINADSIPVLNSIAEKLDKIISEPGLEKEELNGILKEELKKYKALKNKIASRPEIKDSDINDLKSVILAIDWEISETTLQNFEKVVTNQLLKFKNYKIHYTFLKLIHSTGRYIGTQKVNAHTDAISFLHSVFKNFEQIAQSSDMAFSDKKALLENDIKRFHEFKLKIAQKKNTSILSVEIPEEDIPGEDIPDEDDFVQPALSHVKAKEGLEAEDDIAPLTTLLEPDEYKTGEYKSGNNRPQADHKTPATGAKDVMDDLFNIKESPADELLDAIHLMDVGGNNQDQALDMLDQTMDSQSDGIKNFTPRRMDNDPIPEIGTRLDDFFSLAPSDNQISVEDHFDPMTVPEKEEEDLLDGIIPFQDEDESPYENPDDNPAQKDGLEIITQLRTKIETKAWLKDESSMSSIIHDISHLEKQWSHDSEKKALLEIITSMTSLMKNQSETIQKHDISMTDDPDNEILNAIEKKSLGIWGRIKGMFIS